MKDKIKKIFTIIFIVFAILFGFSWAKSCSNVENIKTYENVAQTRQKEPKRANEQEEEDNNKDYIIFDSDIIDKIVIEQNTYLSTDNKVIIDGSTLLHDIDYELKIYFKSGYAYLETEDIIDNFVYNTIGSQDSAFNWWNYHSLYNYSTMTFRYDSSYDFNESQVTTISLKSELIRHNFDYLNNKSIILNSSLSSQFGDNLLNINNHSNKNSTSTINGSTITITNTDTSENIYNIGIRIVSDNSLVGQTFTLSWKNVITTGDAKMIVGLYDGTDFYMPQVQTGNSLTFTTPSNGTVLSVVIYSGWNNLGGTGSLSFSDLMLNKGSYALPYTRYIDISSDYVKVQPKTDDLYNRIYATYFYSNVNQTLNPRYIGTNVLSLSRNTLAFAIGTGTQTTEQRIYDFTNNVYLNAYGLVPRTLSFSNQFNHNNLYCYFLNNYQEGFASYETEIMMTEYLLNNSQPFTTEQIDTYNIGYQVGKSDGIYQALEWTNLIKVLATSLDNFLNIQILPNITIKILIFIPIMFAILSFIIKSFIR